MKALQALEHFKDLIERSGQSLNSLIPETSIKLMLDFYSQNRAEDCDLGNDGDMLLFDWGSELFFNYDITRQFIFSETFQENNSVWQEKVFWQLRLSLMFDPVDELRSLKSGDKWCESPNTVSGFQNFVSNCDATIQIKYYPVKLVELTFDRV